jgi:hypothetical protein
MESFGSLSKARKKELLNITAISERNAWAIALNIIRVLKNYSLDIESEKFGPEDFRKRIAESLSTYQRHAQEKIFLKGTELSKGDIDDIAAKAIGEMVADLSDLKIRRELDRERIAEESFQKMKNDRDK